ncbi:hypothetical protein Q427_11110 [Halomonas sp. BC04]|nr:hypothetical protein [Halomonas sp. ML-15]EWH02007.1 hypothetical protein Q427_11110 [Halomonas sp. BC04]
MTRPSDFADFSQLLAHLGRGGHQPLGGQRLDVLGDVGSGPGVLVWLAPVPLVARLNGACSVRIIGPRPALRVIPGVTQRIERFLMARRRDIERPPGGQLDTGGQRMDMGGAVVITMQHRAGGVLVGLQTGERCAFPVLEDSLDLGNGGVVLRRPGDHPAGIAPPVRTGVGHLGDQVRIAAQHRDLGTAFAVMVMLLEEIPHRAGGASLAVAEKFQVHGSSPCPWSSGS